MFNPIKVFIGICIFMVVGLGAYYVQATNDDTTSLSDRTSKRSVGPIEEDTERVSLEMELLTGSMVCTTYNLPTERGAYYIDSNRGDYNAYYDLDGRRKRLRNAVIYVREVDRCEFTYKRVGE